MGSSIRQTAQTRRRPDRLLARSRRTRGEAEAIEDAVRLLGPASVAWQLNAARAGLRECWPSLGGVVSALLAGTPPTELIPPPTSTTKGTSPSFASGRCSSGPEARPFRLRHARRG